MALYVAFVGDCFFTTVEADGCLDFPRSILGCMVNFALVVLLEPRFEFLGETYVGVVSFGRTQ